MSFVVFVAVSGSTNVKTFSGFATICGFVDTKFALADKTFVEVETV